MDYPIRLELDDNATVLVSFPDFPDARIVGVDEGDAVARAADALTAILHGYVRDHRDIPAPSLTPESRRVAVPALVAMKVSLYGAMRAARVSQSELARRMTIHAPQVRRLLDLRHGSQLEQLEAAFHALGKRLVVGIDDLTAPLATEHRPASRDIGVGADPLEQPTA